MQESANSTRARQRSDIESLRSQWVLLRLYQRRQSWLAWADYLVVTSVGLAVFGATLPLLIFPAAGRTIMAIAAFSCAAALVLLAGYVPAILAHYRIELGARRKGPRERGEPIERWTVVASCICASMAFSATLILADAVAF